MRIIVAVAIIYGVFFSNAAFAQIDSKSTGGIWTTEQWTAYSTAGYHWNLASLTEGPVTITLYVPFPMCDVESKVRNNGMPYNINYVKVRGQAWVNDRQQYDSQMVTGTSDAVAGWESTSWQYNSVVLATGEHHFSETVISYTKTWDPTTQAQCTAVVS